VVPGSVVVVVVVVPGSVVVVVVVVSLSVVDCAMSGVTSTKEATRTTLSEKPSQRPRRNSGRADNFTHLPYFVRNDVLVTGLLQLGRPHRDAATRLDDSVVNVTERALRCAPT
jgi:hypothetical protein